MTRDDASQPDQQRRVTQVRERRSSLLLSACHEARKQAEIRRAQVRELRRAEFRYAAFPRQAQILRRAPSLRHSSTWDRKVTLLWLPHTAFEARSAAGSKEIFQASPRPAR